MKNWLWALALATAADLFGQLTGHAEFIHFSKPLLMPLLAGWFFQATFGMVGWLRKAVLAGLLFSTLGDVLLMFEGSLFFLLGLGAFLVAHVFYLSGFLSKASFSTGYLRQKPLLALPFAAYLLVLLSVLWPGIPAEMRLPVTAYACVISCMALSVLNWKSHAEPLGGRWAMWGALLFVLSDSLIALNKFGQSFADAGVGIMLTYVVGQYLLVRGAARGAYRN